VATRVKPTAKNLYEEDLYAWAHDQAALLRAGRFDALDLEHLIEEVEDLAGSLKSAVRSRATTIMAHLLKLQHSPAQNPRLAWRETIRAQRTRLLNDLPRACAATSPLGCLTSMLAPGTTLRARCGTKGSTTPPSRYPPTAPTPSARSPATGCRSQPLRKR
jgi:hypothetical protein